MFKPKQPNQPNQPTRQRLPMVERPPRQEDIAGLFTGAMRIKGCSFELPIKPANNSPSVWLVTCQFDTFSNEIVWSMYEGEQGSVPLWNCPHNDLDLVFDMVCMSCGSNKSANMPVEVQQTTAPAYTPPTPAPPTPAPIPAPPPANYQQYPGAPYPGGQNGAPPYGAPYQQPAQSPQPYPPQPQPSYNQPPAAPYSPPVQPAPAPYAPPQQAPYSPPFQPNQGYPNNPPYQHQAQPTQPYPAPTPAPQPVYQQPPSPQEWSQQYQAGGAQSPYYPNSAPSQGFPQSQPFVQPAATPGPNSPASQTPGSFTTAGSGAPASLTPEITNFIDLISKGTPNLLLGHLFVEAGIVPNRCLDAALKCQELVRLGRLTNEQAILALKRAAELGGILDDDIVAWARDPDAARAKSRAHESTTHNAQRQSAPAAQPSQPSPQVPPAQPQPRPTSPPPQGAGAYTQSKDNPAMQKVFELLKQAGLVSEADVETARKVRSKHGGELGQILVSAGKVSAQTLDAAKQCQELVTNGRLRIELAIMTLNYCERMRAGLKEAFDELNIELM